MTASNNSEEAIFSQSLTLPATERSAYLDQTCGKNPALRARVEALLRAHDGDGSPFDAVPGGAIRATLTKPLPEEKTGTLIGCYKLLQKIGEGGCGVVYLAEQEYPVRRDVALKVIKQGMDTKEVVTRFGAERQALALMDHPHIARVFDAGATETGRPFFVMELVRGAPITKYCDEKNLSTADRLGLFVQVCLAVQHAHQKGIIHRDLKPSNILVTVNDGMAVPKVIDFGIAKATQGRLTDHTLFTAFDQFIGTPAYMSPEQAEMSSLDIDTRSDIYSLGVLLYELLTGQTPFDAKSLGQAGLDEIRRVIREVEPPKPSTRLSTLTDTDRAHAANRRGTAPAQLTLLLRGDLDWIVMRCLEKDRRRRYETANELAADLQRYLHNEPVAARPPSTVYLLGKFMRRHRLVFGAVAAVAAALLVGTAASLWQAVRATRAERLADTRFQSELAARKEVEGQKQIALERLRAEQDARFETEQQRTLAEQERNRAQSAEKLAAERLQAELVARQEAEQQKALAEAQRVRAEQQQMRAEQERNRAQDAEASARIEAARNAEAAHLMQNMLQGAGPHIALVRDPATLHAVLDLTAQRLLGLPEGAARFELRDALTAVYYDLGDYSTSTAIGGKWAGKDHLTLAPALNQLGMALIPHGWLAEAEVVLREAVAVDRLVSSAGAGRSDSLTMLANLSRVLELAGKAEEAARLEQSLQEQSKKVVGTPEPAPPEIQK